MSNKQQQTQQMLLSPEKIGKLSKPELVKYATSVTATLSSLHDKLFNPETGEIPQLKKQLSCALSMNNFLLSRVTELEKQCTSNAQYARKETIELHGFPADLAPEDVEQRALDMFNLLI